MSQQTINTKASIDNLLDNLVTSKDYEEAQLIILKGKKILYVGSLYHSSYFEIKALHLNQYKNWCWTTDWKEGQEKIKNLAIFID